MPRHLKATWHHIHKEPELMLENSPRPEFARADRVTDLTGLTRTTLYRLLKAGKIKGAMLPITGSKSGVRVFDLSSIRQYINQHLTQGGAQ